MKIATDTPAGRLLLCGLLLFFTCCRAHGQQRLSGQIPQAVRGMKPIGALPASAPIDLVIGLPLRNVSSLDSFLKELYDPNSRNFHNYMNPSRYTEMFAPSLASFESLLDFAQRNKLKIVFAPPNHKFLHVRAPAEVVNRVFHITLMQYRHPTENRFFYAPDQDPAIDLETKISHITGLDNFQMPGRWKNRYSEKGNASPAFAGGSGSAGQYVGNDFRAAYATGVSLTGKGQVVGVVELDGYNASDIATYSAANNIPSVPLQNVYLDNYTGTGSTAPNLESAADIELVISMAPGLSKVVVYGAPFNTAGVHDLLNEMANPSQNEPLPNQLTTSYYFFYDQNVYDSLRQLVAQGQSLFVASGDFGSYDETSGSGTGAFPPADHPLVISVGGTMLTTSKAGGPWNSESAVNFSGGGHSPWGPADPQFVLPPWQVGVGSSLSQASTTARNSPDVAMVATNISVYFNGTWNGFGGTSASAPLWAGFMALVNQQAADQGKSRIGFASPALYAIGSSGTCPSCFHDITTGNNFNSINPAKYQAVAGYDLVTGWGTPNGSSLIDALVDFGPGLAIAFNANIWKGAWGSDGPIFTGDLNGDGKTDVFMWRENFKDWAVNLSTGSGFSQQRRVGAWGSDGPTFTGDLNGDHKTDVFMWRDRAKDWTVNLSQ